MSSLFSETILSVSTPVIEVKDGLFFSAGFSSSIFWLDYSGLGLLVFVFFALGGLLFSFVYYR